MNDAVDEQNVCNTSQVKCIGVNTQTPSKLSSCKLLYDKQNSFPRTALQIWDLWGSIIVRMLHTHVVEMNAAH